MTVIQDAADDSCSGQREGDLGGSDRPTNYRDSHEFLSKLMAGFRQSVHQDVPDELGRDAPTVAPPEVVALLRQMGSPESTSTDIPSSGTKGTGMVCFSCGRSGHGVSRCFRVDTAYPLLRLGWSVFFRDGQYRAVWPTVQPGNADLSGREGPPPGSVIHLVLLSPPQPARRSLRPVEVAVKDIQIVSEKGFVPSPTEISGVQGDLGRMRPPEKAESF